MAERRHRNWNVKEWYKIISNRISRKQPTTGINFYHFYVLAQQNNSTSRRCNPDQVLIEIKKSVAYKRVRETRLEQRKMTVVLLQPLKTWEQQIMTQNVHQASVPPSISSLLTKPSYHRETTIPTRLYLCTAIWRNLSISIHNVIHEMSEGKFIL